MTYVLGFAMFIIAVLAIGLAFYLVKRQRLMYAQAMFRRYNEQKDVNVIVEWIKAKRSSARMLEALEYLFKIKEFELARSLYRAFPFDQFPSRHVRVFACKIFTETNCKKEALELARRLRQAYPRDDSILELYIEAHIRFDEREEARAQLAPRLSRKLNGTVFARQHARILAADGDLEQAIVIMNRIVDRELALAKNTFAQPQKGLLFEQYEESRQFLASLEQKASQQKP